MIKSLKEIDLKEKENYFLNIVDPIILKDTSSLLLHLPSLPKLTSFRELLTWPFQQFHEITEKATPFVTYFHEYLMKGGFPQFAEINDINQAQRLLREDIIDKVIKRDMTALFNVRHILDLERIFLYLCMHDGGLLDLKTLCENLEVKRPTAEKYIELLEATHLVYKLQPFGYGKDILRAKYKIYLADAAISSAVLLKGKALLEDPTGLGIATETAVFKHIYSTLYSRSIGFSYWQGKNKKEVDIIAQVNNHTIPFEIKYREQHTGMREIKGLHEFCKEKMPPIGYVITKSLHDFGVSHLPETNTRILRIPAPLFCYWMGEAEHQLDLDFMLFV